MKRVDYTQLWVLTDEDHLIMATSDYAVWLDKVGELDWQTAEELDAKITEKVKPEEMNTVLNQAAILQAYPVDHLSRVQRDNYSPTGKSATSTPPA